MAGKSESEWLAELATAELEKEIEKSLGEGAVSVEPIDVPTPPPPCAPKPAPPPPPPPKSQKLFMEPSPKHLPKPAEVAAAGAAAAGAAAAGAAAAAGPRLEPPEDVARDIHRNRTKVSGTTVVGVPTAWWSHADDTSSVIPSMKTETQSHRIWHPQAESNCFLMAAYHQQCVIRLALPGSSHTQP